MSDEGMLRAVGRATFGPVIQIRTYTRPLYLVLAFPLGVIYGMTLGFGTVFGLALSVVLIGLLVLFVMLVSIRILTAFERWLADRLLDVDLEETDEARPEGLRETIEHFVSSPRTWRGLGFLSLKFWLGIIGLLLLIGYAQALSLMRGLLGRPYTVDFGEVNGEPVTWTIETTPETVLAIIVGTTLFVVLGHLTALFGYVSERMVSSLLGVNTTSPDPRN